VLPLFILAPLAVLLLFNLPMHRPTQRPTWWAALLLSVSQAVGVTVAPVSFWGQSTVLERFFAFGLTMDGLSRVLLLTIGLVVAAALLVGRQTVTMRDRQGGFTSLVVIAMIGMNGTVLLSDLFSLYVFIEITSVSSFVLVAMNRDPDGLEGAFKYLILSAVATILMIGSVALLLLVSGSTGFGAVASALKGSGHAAIPRIAVGAFVCGLLIKGGLVPFHGWLPAAYSAAPAPVSVLLAGVATKASGIYALVRLTTSVFTSSASLNETLLLVGTVSIVVGAVAALTQTDMKRLLAYSSISQVGYIVLGLGCGSELGIAGAVFHLFNHAVFKSLLFVNSAAVERRLGTTDMNRMGGLGSRMPLTSITSAIATLSTAGIPPLAGFWSKLIIVLALWRGQHYAYAGIAVLFSVVTLAYLLGMHRRVFFGKTPQELLEIREADWGLVLPAVALAVITVAVGLLIPLVFNTFLLPVGGIL